MSKLADQITQKIKQENIRPKARWHFLLRDYLLWTVFILNLLFGAVFFAVFLLALDNSILALFWRKRYSWSYFFQSIPFLRLGLLILFVFLAYYNYRYTPRGYRRRTQTIIAMSLVIITMTGLTIFALGWSKHIDSNLSRHLPFYHHWEQRQKEIWQKPEEGLLSGVITKVNENSLELLDLNGKVWEVELSAAVIRGPRRNLTPGQRIKVVGEKINQWKFKATEIRTGGFGNRR